MCFEHFCGTVPCSVILETLFCSPYLSPSKWFFIADVVNISCVRFAEDAASAKTGLAAVVFDIADEDNFADSILRKDTICYFI